MNNTGAVVMGRRAYEMASGDFTGYEFQVPIFVVSHRPPKDAPKGQNANLSIAFVTEGTDAAVQRAKKAAGARDDANLRHFFKTPNCSPNSSRFSKPRSIAIMLTGKSRIFATTSGRA